MDPLLVTAGCIRCSTAMAVGPPPLLIVAFGALNTQPLASVTAMV